MLDPLTALAFPIYENKGVTACCSARASRDRLKFRPAGKSRSTWWRRVAALQGVTGEPDWAKWYKTTFGTDPGYSQLLDQLASIPDERRSVLHSYIEPNEDDIAAGRKPPTRANQAIARLVAAGHLRVIITTVSGRGLPIYAFLGKE
jgi:hypothetical protein